MCSNGEFYVALGAHVSLALLVWGDGGLLNRVLRFSVISLALGEVSLFLHIPSPNILFLIHNGLNGCFTEPLNPPPLPQKRGHSTMLYIVCFDHTACLCA